jgi:hypothetical protein
LSRTRLAFLLWTGFWGGLVLLLFVSLVLLQPPEVPHCGEGCGLGPYLAAGFSAWFGIVWLVGVVVGFVIRAVWRWAKRPN